MEKPGYCNLLITNKTKQKQKKPSHHLTSLFCAWVKYTHGCNPYNLLKHELKRQVTEGWRPSLTASTGAIITQYTNIQDEETKKMGEIYCFAGLKETC